MAACVGSPTFEVSSKNPNRFVEWPANIGGYICKTPPFGQGNAPRFAQCCSGTVFNITSPTDKIDPAYPMSCALFCQVDPKLTELTDDGSSPHMDCLTDGGKESSNWELVCATNPVASEVPFPTSYPSTFSEGATAVESGPAESRTTTGPAGTTSADSTITTGPSSAGTSDAATPAVTATSSSGGGIDRDFDRKLTIKAWVLGAVVVLAMR